MRVELDETDETTAGDVTAVAARLAPAASKGLMTAVALTATVVSAITFGVYRRQAASPLSQGMLPVARFVVDLQSWRPVHGVGQARGRVLERWFAVRDLPRKTPRRCSCSYAAFDELESEAVAGTERGIAPILSPDGEWVAFFADGKLKKVPISGGIPIDRHVTPRPCRWVPIGRRVA